MTAPPEELVDATEIARRLGVRRASVVLDWRLHHLDFPRVVARRRAYLWRWSDVAAWFEAHAHEVLR
jgi:hypothetical protein